MRRTSNLKIRHEVDEQARESASIAATFLGNTGSVLSIPTVDESVIPTRFTSGENLAGWSQLALNLMRYGYIDKGTDLSVPLMDIVQSGLNKWLDPYLGQLELFNFSIRFDVETDNPNVNEDLEEETVLQKKLYFIMDAGNLASFTIGKQLEELETLSPGLGKTAYYWLAVTGARTLNVMTPWAGGVLALQQWWFWQETQEEWVDEIKSYDEEITDEQIAEMIGPEDWVKQFPEWATKISKPLKKAELERLASAKDGSLQSEVASDVLELMKLESASLPGLEDTDYMGAYHGMYLFWEQGDTLNRLLDDWFEHCNQMGDMSTYLGQCKFSVSPMEFRRWKVSIEKGLTQLINLERLIKKVGIQI